MKIIETHVHLWKTLETLILDLKRKGALIPQEVIEDLKSAKTMISIYEIDSSYMENLSDIEFLFNKVEISLISIAEADFGKEYGDECLRRISETRKINNSQKHVSSSNFVLGIPKGEHWIKFKPGT